MFKPFIVFAPEDPPGGGAPAPAADPAPAAPAPAPAADPAPGPGPWATDLATYLPDEAAQQSADRFLREKVQPHITQLESHPSRQLWSDLLEDAPTALGDVVSELISDEAGEAFAEWYAQQLEGGNEPATEPAPTATDAAQLSAEDRELLDWARGQKEQTEQTESQSHYDSELARIKQLPGGENIVDEIFDPFVVAADGDFDTALEGWKKYGTTLLEKFGISTEAAPAPAAPTVLGGDAPAAGAPPVEKKYASFDEALDDTIAEAKARREAPQTL